FSHVNRGADYQSDYRTTAGPLPRPAWKRTVPGYYRRGMAWTKIRAMRATRRVRVVWLAHHPPGGAVARSDHGRLDRQLAVYERFNRSDYGSVSVDWGRLWLWCWQ